MGDEKCEKSHKVYRFGQVYVIFLAHMFFFFSLIMLLVPLRTSFAQVPEVPPLKAVNVEEGCVRLLGSLPIRTEQWNVEGRSLVLRSVDGKKKRFKNFSMKTLKFGEREEYETSVYYPTRAAKPGQASALVVFFHGMNASISHGASRLSIMEALTKSEDNIEAGSPLDQARKIFPRVQNLAVEAPDMPGCGHNCNLDPLKEYETTLDFFTQYLRKARAKYGQIPIVASGYCFGAGFSIEVDRNSPSLIDGLMPTGLVIPDHELGFDYSAAVETEMYKKGTLFENPAVRALGDNVYAKLPWSREVMPTGKTPTLLINGENDPFQSAEAKALYAKWAANDPEHFKLLLVPGGGHGVLAPIDGHPESYVSVLVEINRFIAGILKHH